MPTLLDIAENLVRLTTCPVCGDAMLYEKKDTWRCTRCKSMVRSPSISVLYDAFVKADDA